MATTSVRNIICKGLLSLAIMFLSPCGLRADPVSNLSYTFASSDTLSISWGLQPETSYQIVVSTLEDFSIVIGSNVTPANQATTSYFNLQPNTSHTFLVKVSTDPDTNYLAVSTFTLSKSPGCGGFQIFTTSVAVFLINNGNPAGSTATYRVLVSTDGFSTIAFSSQGMNELNGNAPALTVFGLQANSTYQIGIDALSYTNIASSRTSVSDSTSTLAKTPGAFAVFTQADIGISSISISWTPNGNPLTPPTSYQLQVSTDINFGIFTASETFITNTSTTGLIPNTSYYFRVCAFNREGGQTGFNTKSSTYTLALSPVPIGFQMFVTSVTVNLLPNGNPQETLYRVLISTDGFSTIAFSSQGTSLSLSPSGLQANSTYQIGIDALSYTNIASSRTSVSDSTSTLAAIPGAFTAFTQADIGVSSISIIWAPNGNPLTPPTSYQLQVSTDINFGIFTASETFITNASTTGLIPNTSYYFRVCAFNREVGQSGFNTKSATCTLAVSPVPGGFQIFTTSVTVNLLPNGNPQETLYRVLISTDGFSTIAFSSQGTSPSLSPSGLQANSTYQIGIDALSYTNIASSRTSVSDSTSTLAAIPGAFTAFIPANISTSNISISWDPNINPLTPPTSYQLQISTDAGFGIFTTSETFTTNASTAGLIPNTSYYFRARAYSRMGEPTNFNSTVTTFTLAEIPKNLASPAQTVSSIQLQWLSNNSPYSRVEISSSMDNFSASIATPIPFSANFTGATTTFFNLKEKTSYFFRVRALNETNAPSDFSVILNTNTLSINPNALSSLNADIGGGASLDSSIQLSWTAPSENEGVGGNVIFYIVRYATFDVTTSDFDSPLVSTYTQNWTPAAAGNPEIKVLTGFNPGTTYYFAIKSSDSAGNISHWNSADNPNRKYWARDSVLAAPTNPTINLFTSTSVTLSWTVPPAPAYFDDRDSYKVYWATCDFSSAFEPFVFQTTGTFHPATFATVTGLQNETSYYFRVTSVDRGDQGSGMFSIPLESALSNTSATITLDSVAPAAVSDLTALTGAQEGTVVLQWTAPGDDGTNRNLVGGSLYEIKYTSAGIINSGNYGNPPAPAFTKTISTQATLGSPQGTLITGLLSAATYWFAIKTRDESSNYSVWNSSSDNPAVNLRLSTISQRDNVSPATITGLALTPGYKKFSLNWVVPGDDGLAGNLTGFFRIKYGISTMTTSSEFDAAPSTVTITTTSAGVNSWTPGTVISTVIAGLSNNVTYHFVIRANDDSGNMSPFAPGELKSDYPRNQQPGTFTLSSPVDNTVIIAAPQTLSWNASADPDGPDGDGVTYIVQYSTLQNFALPFVSSAPSGVSTSTTGSLALIENSSTYWRVRAKDNDDYTTFSDTRLLRINLVNTLPSTFSLLIPAISSIVPLLTPALDWETSSDPDPGDALTYTLKYSPNSDAEGGITVTGITTSFYTIPSAVLSDNTTYYWKVFALSTNPFTGTDTVQGSATFYFRINSVPEQPNAFNLLYPGANDRSTTTLPTFVWQQATDNDLGDIVTYNLTVQNINYSTTVANIALTTYTLTAPLVDNLPYTWTVVAISSPDGLTRTAAPVGGYLLKTDTEKQLPTAVTLSSPTHQSLVNTSSPTLKWNSVTDPDNALLDHPQMDRVRYVVKIGEKVDYTDALGQQVFFSDSNGFDTQRQFSLKDQTTYFWQVASAGYQPLGFGGAYVHVDTGGLTGCTQIIGGGSDECYSVSLQFSFIVSLVNTPPASCSLLAPKNNTILNTNMLTFDWTDSAETDPAQTIDYTLEISTTSDFSTPFSISTGIVTSSYTTVTPLLQNRTYYWRVFTQDRFSDQRPAGNSVVSAQNFFFRIPVLTTPKEPTSVKGTLSPDKNSFVISWNAVTQNRDGSAMTDLDGYNIYRSPATSGLGTGTPLAKVPYNTVTYADHSVAGGEFYYVTRAINSSFLAEDTSGTISINSNAVKSVSDASMIIIPSEPDLQGKIEIVIPEDVKSVLEKSGNIYGEDLKFQLVRTPAAGLKDALMGVSIKIVGAQSDKEMTNFVFDKPITVGFPFNGFFAKPFPAAAQNAPGSPQELSVFWYNGVEWLNLGGAVNPSNNNVFVRTRNVGEFGAKAVVKATEFELSAVTPNRIFTPNGDFCNDIAAFQIQNPKGFSNVKAKIFDLRGAFVADMNPASSLGTLTFDSNCPKPNLADDTWVWDGKDSSGNYAPKGIYIYQFEAEGKTINGTIVVAR